MEASFTIVLLLLAAATTALWIWALVDVLRRPAGTYRSGSQLVWVLVIALTHSIGAVAYLLIGRPRSAEPLARAMNGRRRSVSRGRRPGGARPAAR